MICTRGNPAPGGPRHPANCVNRFWAFVLPWVWVIPPEVQERGAHLIVARTPRIPPDCVDPTIKNYHWGDLTRALFEAKDAGAANGARWDLTANAPKGRASTSSRVSAAPGSPPNRARAGGPRQRSGRQLGGPAAGPPSPLPLLQSVFCVAKTTK